MEDGRWKMEGWALRVCGIESDAGTLARKGGSELRAGVPASLYRETLRRETWRAAAPRDALCAETWRRGDFETGRDGRWKMEDGRWKMEDGGMGALSVRH
jgi:hypothetical protein